MGRKRKDAQDMIEVRITGPNCDWDDRHLLPGETATVPAELADEWIQGKRATAVIAEVSDDNG